MTRFLLVATKLKTGHTTLSWKKPYTCCMVYMQTLTNPRFCPIQTGLLFPRLDRFGQIISNKRQTYLEKSLDDVYIACLEISRACEWRLRVFTVWRHDKQESIGTACLLRCSLLPRKVLLAVKSHLILVHKRTLAAAVEVYCESFSQATCICYSESV